MADERAASPQPMESWPTGRVLSTAARMVEHAWAETLESVQLTHAGLVVLHLLDRGPSGQRDLARTARVEAQTMSRTLDRLERAGFIERRNDPDDLRRHVVVRTEEGGRVWRTARGLEAEILPDVSDPEGLRRLLLEVIRSLEKRRWS